MITILGKPIELQAGGWLEVIYEIYIGLVVGIFHGPRVIYSTFARFLRKILKLPEADSTQQRKNEGLKVVGVGYGRTGTVSSSHRSASVAEAPWQMVRRLGWRHKELVSNGRHIRRQSISYFLVTVDGIVCCTGHVSFANCTFGPCSHLVYSLQYSLNLALDELGFPALHTQHLYENSDIIGMWTSEIILPSIQSGRAELGRPNLKLIASKGYQATTDLPMALYFEQVMEEYPDCKFILTTRENSEVWFRSWDTLTKSIAQPAYLGGLFFSNVNKVSLYLRWLFAIVGQDNSYLTVAFPFPDQSKKAAIASYEDHNRRVRTLIPKEKLLEYNVEQGWQPLCDFLEIADCPNSPFPKTNSARSVQVQSISSQIAPLMLILFCLFYAFASFVRRVTGMTVLQWVNCQRTNVAVKLGLTRDGHKVHWGPATKSKRKKPLAKLA